MIPYTLLGLILILFCIQQTVPDPKQYCHNYDSIWDSIWRDLNHGSPLVLLGVGWSLYNLFYLERHIGSFNMLCLVVWLLLICNILQHFSGLYMKFIMNGNKKRQLLHELDQYQRQLDNEIPCDLGFFGIILALNITAIYLTTPGRLSVSWDNILWTGFYLLPSILFATVSLHGQISGFLGGIITVVLLDYLGIGW